MKKHLLSAFLLLLPLLSLSAQTIAEETSLAEDSLVRQSFVERLVQSEENQPKVTMQQDTAIYKLIGQPGVNRPENIVIVQNRPCLQMLGYRIQVFSSNNQKTAKAEAFRRETAIKQVVPDMTSYVKYQAPFWRVRVGDFQTYEDAYAKLVEFRKTFVFGREMSIVRETINLPL